MMCYCTDELCCDFSMCRRAEAISPCVAGPKRFLHVSPNRFTCCTKKQYVQTTLLTGLGVLLSRSVLQFLPFVTFNFCHVLQQRVCVIMSLDGSLLVACLRCTAAAKMMPRVIPPAIAAPALPFQAQTSSRHICI